PSLPRGGGIELYRDLVDHRVAARLLARQRHLHRRGTREGGRRRAERQRQQEGRKGALHIAMVGSRTGKHQMAEDGRIPWENGRGEGWKASGRGSWTAPS